MAFGNKKADPFKPGKKKRQPGLGVKPTKKPGPKKGSAAAKKGGK